MEQLIVLMLATWALSWLLVDGHGPKNILDMFRHWIGARFDENGNRYGKTWLGDLFNCEVCLSVWLSIPLAMAIYQQQWNAQHWNVHSQWNQIH